MDNGYFAYGKKMNDIGNKIMSISNRFAPKQSHTKNIDELRLIKAICLEAIDGYRMCKDDLISVIPPFKVKKEHEDLINTMQSLIDGTEFIFRSIDVENQASNEELKKLGYSTQEMAITTVVQITNIIVDKLI